MEPKEIKLPSGASLKISLAPFADGRTMYQVVLEELKGMKLNPKDEVDVNFRKDLFCTFLASKRIEAAAWKCAERALYNGKKISEETFEPAECRDDYITAMFEIAKENIAPFAKSLYAEYAPLFAVVLGESQA